MANRPTRYEIIAENADGSIRIHLGFSARVGRSPLLAAISGNEDRLLLMGPGEGDAHFVGGGKQARLELDGITIRYGRTENTVKTLTKEAAAAK